MRFVTEMWPKALFSRQSTQLQTTGEKNRLACLHCVAAVCRHMLGYEMMNDIANVAREILSTFSSPHCGNFF